MKNIKLLILKIFLLCLIFSSVFLVTIVYATDDGREYVVVTIKGLPTDTADRSSFS